MNENSIFSICSFFTVLCYSILPSIYVSILPSNNSRVKQDHQNNSDSSIITSIFLVCQWTVPFLNTWHTFTWFSQCLSMKSKRPFCWQKCTNRLNSEKVDFLVTVFITTVWYNVFFNAANAPNWQSTHDLILHPHLMSNDPEPLPEKQLLTSHWIVTSSPWGIYSSANWIPWPNSANGRRSSANNRGHQTGLSPDLECASISCQWKSQDRCEYKAHPRHLPWTRLM